MREIVFYPDPVLSKRCREVIQGPYAVGENDKPESVGMKWGWIDRDAKPINEYIQALVEDMKETLFSTQHGVGLAAPQVGVDLRIFIMSLDRKAEPIVAINPAYSDPQGTETAEEGCLSVPGVGGLVTRPKSVIVSGQYLNGDKFSFRAEGLIARVCQHEIDHLDGKMFFERFNMNYRKKAEPTLEKLKRQYKQWNDRLARKAT